MSSLLILLTMSVHWCPVLSVAGCEGQDACTSLKQDVSSLMQVKSTVEHGGSGAAAREKLLQRAAQRLVVKSSAEASTSLDKTAAKKGAYKINTDVSQMKQRPLVHKFPLETANDVNGLFDGLKKVHTYCREAGDWLDLHEKDRVAATCQQGYMDVECHCLSKEQMGAIPVSAFEKESKMTMVECLKEVYEQSKTPERRIVKEDEFLNVRLTPSPQFALIQFDSSLADGSLGSLQKVRMAGWPSPTLEAKKALAGPTVEIHSGVDWCVSDFRLDQASAMMVR